LSRENGVYRGMTQEDGCGETPRGR